MRGRLSSGAAGIAHWINNHYGLKDGEQIEKSSELVTMVKAWVDRQYEEGRVTVLTDDELEKVADDACLQLGIKLRKE